GLLKTLSRRPHVIITTAYPEYAVEGFELSVTDYLLKPFSLERVLQAVGKVQHPKEARREEASGTVESRMTSLFVKSDKKIIKIELKDLVYAEAYGNYVKVYTDTMILTAQTLSDFLTQLPDDFLRIHKSYIINFNHLKLIDGNQVLLGNGTKLPVGKSYRKAILGRI
ncbi:MAG: LytR/AlgR family response regulator transcription factor, partial [Flavobacteriaceae bacterium]